MNIIKRFNKFLDKYGIVDRQDDAEYICNYERLNCIELNQKQINFVNILILKKYIPSIIVSIIFIFLIVLIAIFGEIKTVFQAILLLIFGVEAIILFCKSVKGLKIKCSSNTKAYLATVIEKNLVSSSGKSSSAFVIRVLFENNQKDFVSLENNKFAKKIKKGDKIIVVKINNLYAIPYEY